MQLIDTHAHIYLPEFDADRAPMLQASLDAGIDRIFMPAIDSQTHAAMLACENQTCSAMMGLHPCSVKEDYEKELQVVSDHLSQRPFAAVGEIGLDFYWDKTFVSQQYLAFETQIRWAQQFGLPVVIHSRNALEECIGVVKKFPGLRGIFHCFSGTAGQARAIMELGFYLGIGGVITYKNAGLDRVLAEVGIAQLVLETDAPYLSPVPFRGKRNETRYLTYVAEKVAAVCGITVTEVGAITTKNAINLFQLSHKP
jgi:TatD DNase family protein